MDVHIWWVMQSELEHHKFIINYIEKFLINS